jgi:hypothetical protein
MHDIFSREPDPLDGMLRPPSPPDNKALRQAVYTRTRRVLHRRRRLWQLAYAAGLLVSFALGAAVVRMTISGERGRVSAPSAQAPNPQTQPLGAQALGALTRPRSPSPDESPLAREWIAFDSEDHRAERYREAGNRYMTEENDLQSALRCFSNALDNGTEQDLVISADDNWLLMAIKDARQKEKKHAKQGG